ncbi:MAG: class I SAM-dependent methyltransferase [Lachnospiraceae bacterium]|nr:class I SAM-dependent methyltransferase [Lachnospiraceae bacterium]
MWVADNWKDYEVIDTSKGEKLERWGEYRLVRPDPQVIWNTPKDNNKWRKKNGHYHRSKKGGGEWEFFNLPEEWQISYPLFTSDSAREFLENENAASPIAKELTFNLKPFSFKHTGLFPEQAVNWDWMSRLILKYRFNNPDEQPKILNLFAYTGGATLAAAASGAHVTHVDASKGMVNWAKENAVSSGLKDAPIRWLVDDCVKFVEREIRRGNIYDAIIMDPPSYGRGPKGEIWKIEESVYPLILKCAEILSDRPLFFLINSYTTGLQSAVLTYMLSTALSNRPGKCVASEIGLLVSENGLILPCGASGRFEGTAE